MIAQRFNVERGIDTVQALDEGACKRLYEAGYTWVARYIPRDGRRLEEPDTRGGDHRGCWTLSASELRIITRFGLSLLPVQWGPSRVTPITAAYGHHLGGRAAAAARWYGIPMGTHLWCDLEGGVAGRAGAGGCIAYVEAWAAAAITAGYRAGLYVGDPGVPLDAEQLHMLRGITSYWRSATRVRALNGEWYARFRGWSILQSLPSKICGVSCDPDAMRPDDRGDLPYLVAM